MFLSLLFAQLTHSIGLNDVCDALRLHSGPLSSIRGATTPSRNNLSHATAGNERRAIYRDDQDRRHFCHLLQDLVERFRISAEAVTFPAPPVDCFGTDADSASTAVVLCGLAPDRGHFLAGRSRLNARPASVSSDTETIQLWKTERRGKNTFGVRSFHSSIREGTPLKILDENVESAIRSYYLLQGQVPALSGRASWCRLIA